MSRRIGEFLHFYNGIPYQTMSDLTPYYNLSPDVVLSAVESRGYVSNWRLLALNSYENRVYQVGIEEKPPIIAKFYRPGRWRDEQILEEHAFSIALAEQEIPVVPPDRDEQGETLFRYENFRFALFARHGGRAPELDNDEHLEWLGRFIGRIHAVGALAPFRHRPTLDIKSFGRDAVDLIERSGYLPPYVRDNYLSVANDLLERVQYRFDVLGPYRKIRLHGDCHPGNILWTEGGPHFVDLDDARMGPAVQDLWMLLSGERDDMLRQLDAILRGYEMFNHFNEDELGLIEALRALRLTHYAAWITSRWEDPAFPHNFPWFNTPRYWEEHVQSLREQIAVLEEPPLMLMR